MGTPFMSELKLISWNFAPKSFARPDKSWCSNMSSTASAAAQASGFPVNVPPNPPGPGASYPEPRGGERLAAVRAVAQGLLALKLGFMPRRGSGI